MYLIEPFFRLTQSQGDFAEYARLLNAVIDQWRYNGQIIGREISLYFAEQDSQTGFAMRLVCPEQHSLLPEFNNLNVQKALTTAEKSGLFLENFVVIGDDFNADRTTDNPNPSWQVVYTTHLQSCSPLHSGDDFCPIPLYHQLQNQPYLSQDIIKWQENWQACDQLQMNGATLEQPALAEISDFNSSLSKHGYSLAQEIEHHSQIPTYYYLYRVGGESLDTEQHRCCPSCGGNWALPEPLFDIFYFKCDQCRLVSNLSWNFL